VNTPRTAIPLRGGGDAAIDDAGMGQHQRRTERSRAWRRFRSYRPGLAGLGIVGLLFVIAILAAPLAPYEPNAIQTRLRGDGPSREHLLGNDDRGRDVLSRLIYGTRIALIVGLGATAIALSIGVSIGATAGYFGGKVDFVLSRIIDTLMAFPTLALLITLAAVVGPSLINVILAIGTTVWASYARIVRADVLSLRERDYVLAARASGAGSARIIIRHMLPNVLGPVVVLATLGIGGIIILESALSFLGLGIQPPDPSWGGMLSDGRAHIRNYPHIAIAPGIAIGITVLAFNLLGDGLRDALDPRQRG
jgi:ABC-type dipeptide/oligopeptide/nickel transport system permease subunit